MKRPLADAPPLGRTAPQESSTPSPRSSTDRTHIALVTDAIFPYNHGGKEIRTHELAQRLSRYGDVHVYTMKWWDGPTVRRDGDVTFHGISPRVNLYTKGRRSILQALVFAICCLRLATAPFDVLEADHMPYWQLLPLWAIARVHGKRFVVTWHEAWGPEYWREYLGSVGIIGWWIERFTMSLPDAIIAASPHTAERLQVWVDPARIFVAPNGIDLAAVRAVQPAASGPDLVTVGRLLSHKRVDLLIDAVAMLKARGQRLTCRVIGNGPERTELEDQIRRLDLIDQVTIVTDVAAQTDMYAELKSARVFVFPSEREGFGIAALEALACGLPVITTAAPDNMARHLVTQSERGVVCAPDVEALADAIGQALHSDTDSSRDTEEWLNGFDWEVIAHRVAQTLQV